MSRMMADCRRYPSVMNCSLVLIGEEDEVLQAAVDHAVSVHGHQADDELRTMLRDGLEPASAYEPDRQPA